MPKTISFSRRRFAQLIGAGAAHAMTRGSSLAGAQADPLASPLSLATLPGQVRLNSNENPYGPSPLALRAMTDAFSLAWRYPDEHADLLVESLAETNGVSRDQILLGNGSGEILKVCASAFTGPMSNSTRPLELARATRGGELKFFPGRGKLIVADPTFEAILNYARVNNAEVVKVPLTSSFAHNLPQMLSAARAGLIYICNPNNPTASITPKHELRDFIAAVPRRTMILVDEAYFHYAGSSDYESVIPLIKDHSNLIVARTFSKIYGMAGLRCGYCIAQPETIRRMRLHQTWDSVNIMALAAAIASLNDAEQVRHGRRMNDEARTFVSGELHGMGYQHISSQANFMMIDLKRPVRPIIQALGQRGVQVGRVFSSLPNHLRVTIGKRFEMETFLAAFRQTITTA